MRNDKVEISVIVPTYERPLLLKKLLLNLSYNTFKNFEVIVIDQSCCRSSMEGFDQRLNIKYHHVTFKGAAMARNYAARVATAPILAFTDDDCLPDQRWLEMAYLNFQSRDIVGIEGKILSSKYKNKPQKYRIVSNNGREGLAFMTANLFVLREYFLRLNGFDERFNNPHFREDTDFGWRLLTQGQVPFNDKVKVLHPSFTRKQYRDTVAERNSFFVQDALLYSKHPLLYPKLFAIERHYVDTPEFWNYFFQGFRRHNVDNRLVKELFKYKDIDIAYFPMEQIIDFIQL